MILFCLTRSLSMILKHSISCLILLSFLSIATADSNLDYKNDPWHPEIFEQGNNDVPMLWNDKGRFMGNQMEVSVPYVSKQAKPFMVIGCLSTENEFQLRENVRESWARSNVGKDILVWFVVGAPQSSDIIQEAKEYNDILFINVPEFYSPGMSTLPVKVHGYFQIAHKYFPKTQYFMKTDDDVFILLDKVLDKIENSHNPFSKNTLFGSVIFRAKSLIRQSFNKNYVSIQQYPNLTIEAHPAGLGYILTNELTSCINRLSALTTADYNPNEDMFTGLLIRRCPIVQFVDMDSYLFETKNIRRETDIAFVHGFKSRGKQNELFAENCKFMKNCEKLEHTLALNQLLIPSDPIQISYQIEESISYQQIPYSEIIDNLNEITTEKIYSSYSSIYNEINFQNTISAIISSKDSFEKETKFNGEIKEFEIETSGDLFIENIKDNSILQQLEVEMEQSQHKGDNFSQFWLLLILQTLIIVMLFVFYKIIKRRRKSSQSTQP